MKSFALTTLLLLVLVSPTLAISKPTAISSTKNEKTVRFPFSGRIKQQAKRAAALKEKTKENGKALLTKQQESREVDFPAIGKYIGALGVQVSGLYLVWSSLDFALAKFKTDNKGLPRWLSFLVIYAINLQAGKFNPLPNVPEQRQTNASPNRKQPSWVPPGWVFFLMWPFFVFGTRAYTMAIIAEKVGCYANSVTLSMMIHFSFGSLWNSINRVENRLGVSMLMLYGLVITKAITAYVAFGIDRNAGIALATTLSWICAAAAIGTSVWRLNPMKTGELEPLYPVKQSK